MSEGKSIQLSLDGESLTPEALVHIGYGQLHSTSAVGGSSPALKPPSEANMQHRDAAVGADKRVHVVLSAEAWGRVRTGRAVVDRVLARKEVAYGINTGFGNFANVIIGDDKLKELQCNLIRSHASGIGQPLSLAQTRMLMALRANVLAKGHSGVREETLQRMLAALNANCLPWVPCKGSVGASGDLAPLSHLALGLMGEGLMYDPTSGQFANASEVLKKHGLKPIELQAKEGLALINGTQLITSIAAEAVVRSKRIARQSDVIAAMTLEALRGSITPFHPAIHASRAHRGQGLVAARVRSILTGPSEIMNSHHNCGKVQDSYTLRCVPQIHGISHDTIQFCYGILMTECNSATDNPMIFASLHRDTIPASPSFAATPVPTFDGSTLTLTAPAASSHSHTHSHSHGSVPHVHVEHHHVPPVPHAHAPISAATNAQLFTPHPTRTLYTAASTHMFATDCPMPHTAPTAVAVGPVATAAAAALVSVLAPQAVAKAAAAAGTGNNKRKAVTASPASSVAAMSSASDSDTDSISSTSTVAPGSAAATSVVKSPAASASQSASSAASAAASAVVNTGFSLLHSLSAMVHSSHPTPAPAVASKPSSPGASPVSSSSTPPATPPTEARMLGAAAGGPTEKKMKTDAKPTAMARSTSKDEKSDDPAAVNPSQMGVILSGGNFHGEYPAKAADILAIGVHELSSVSERRIERLVNPALSSLPAFLTDKGGLNSGFMIAHCAAASLVSENKVLCHPSSVDSLSTSAAQEDHVSMGGFAARKALTVVEHVETVLAIELLAACQALDYLRPLRSTKALEAVHKLVRSVVPKWTNDRFMSPDIEAAVALLQNERVWAVASPFIDEQFHEL